EVEPADASMGVRRAQHASMRLSVEVIVALKTAVAAQKTLVLETPHRLPNTEFAHYVTCSAWCEEVCLAGSYLQGRVDESAGHKKGTVPARPSSRNGPAGIAVTAPADIGSRRRLDEFRRIVGHRKFEGRDIALVPRAAIGIRSDHHLDVDQPEIGVAQSQQSWRRRLGLC